MMPDVRQTCGVSSVDKTLQQPIVGEAYPHSDDIFIQVVQQEIPLEWIYV